LNEEDTGEEIGNSRGISISKLEIEIRGKDGERRNRKDE